MLPFIIIFAFLTIGAPILFAQGIGGELSQDLSFGQYPIPLLLTIIMAFIYRAIPVIPDRLKGFITVAVAIALGYLWLVYSSVTIDVHSLVDTFAYCFIQGCAAVGIYELQDKARKPKGQEDP